MKIAVLQPSYLPWLGYLDQIASVDAFVFYDDVQFDRHGWRNRNRIRVDSERGWAWLTVPVLLQHGFPALRDVAVDGRVPWRRKHRATIRSVYSKARHVAAFDRFFGEYYAASGADSLADLAIESVRCCMRAFDLATPVFRSSALDIAGDRTTRLVNICRHFGADEYLTGAAARRYLDVARFADAGIAVRFQDYAPRAYPQPWTPFVSHLSAIDALLNLGEDAKALVGADRNASR